MLIGSAGKTRTYSPLINSQKTFWTTCIQDLHSLSRYAFIPALTRCHYDLNASRPPIHISTASPYPYHPNTLGDHLRKRRLDLGLTQKQLAEDVLHTSISNVRNWELNYRSTSLQFRKKVYEFIGFCPCDVSLPLGLRLRERRENLGLSIRRLSQILQLDPCTIASWERGEHEPIKRSTQIIQLFLKSYGYD